MTQLSLWLGAQALLQDIEGWGHPRAGSLQATLDLSFKSWANLFGDLHLALGVKFWTIPLLIFCLCDHTVLVVGVFVCVDWIGKSHSGLCRMGKFYLHHLGSLPFQGLNHSGLIMRHSRFILFQEPGQSGSLHLALEVEFGGYSLSDLLLVETYLLFLSMSMCISTRIGWLRHPWPLSPDKGVFLYCIGFEYSGTLLGNFCFEACC